MSNRFERWRAGRSTAVLASHADDLKLVTRSSHVTSLRTSTWEATAASPTSMYEVCLKELGVAGCGGERVITNPIRQSTLHGNRVKIETPTDNRSRIIFVKKCQIYYGTILNNNILCSRTFTVKTVNAMSLYYHAYKYKIK